MQHHPLSRARSPGAALAARPAGARARAGGLLLVLLVPLLACASGRDEAAGADADVEVIDMRPDDLASFGMKNVTAPIGSLFLGFNHFYAPREIRIDTTPSGGMVDLFYVRSNFQKRFEQADTPVRIIVPARVEAGPRDSITIRAFAEGFRQQTRAVKLSSSVDEVTIDLEPLPNTLDGLSHRYFAGRASLGFLTDENLSFRVQEAADGFAVVLNETAMTPEARAAVDGLRDPLIAGAFGQQLGEDLLVKVSLSDAARGSTRVLSRQQYNAARDLHEFVLDLVPEDGGAASVQGALDALAGLGPGDVTGCALTFDDTLRGELDPGALNRALAPQGDFTDRYLRAAMRRLGEVTPGGAVSFSHGSRYRPSVPIELEVSLSQAADAEGFLALLRSFVFDLEPEPYRRETLRSLIAPELDDETFDVVLQKAEAAEASCRSAS